MSVLSDSRLRIIFGVTLMAVMGVSSIVPVFPAMMDHFGLTAEKIGLTITVFTLPGVVLAPLAGLLADRFGRKQVLLPALALFGLCGGACMLADSFGALLWLRFGQGIGASALGVLYGTLIGDLFHGRDLADAMGINAGVLGMGTAIYPAVGGLLGLISWHAPFLLPLLAFPLGWLVLARLPLPERQRSPESFGGYLRSTLGHLNAGHVKGLFALVFVTFLLLYGPLITFYPVLLDERYGVSPAVIGILLSTASLLSGLAASQMGRISRLVPEKVLLQCGMVSYAACFLITPFVGSAAAHLWPLLLFGLGQGLTFPVLMTLVNRAAPHEYRGGYMAMYGMLLRLSQTVAPLLSGAVHLLFGLDAVYYVGVFTALAGLAAVVAFVRVPPAGEHGAQDAGPGVAGL